MKFPEQLWQSALLPQEVRYAMAVGIGGEKRLLSQASRHLEALKQFFLDHQAQLLTIPGAHADVIDMITMQRLESDSITKFRQEKTRHITLQGVPVLEILEGHDVTRWGRRLVGTAVEYHGLYTIDMRNGAVRHLWLERTNDTTVRLSAIVFPTIPTTPEELMREMIAATSADIALLDNEGNSISLEKQKRDGAFPEGGRLRRHQYIGEFVDPETHRANHVWVWLHTQVPPRSRWSKPADRPTPVPVFHGPLQPVGI